MAKFRCKLEGFLQQNFLGLKKIQINTNKINYFFLSIMDLNFVYLVHLEKQMAFLGGWEIMEM